MHCKSYSLFFSKKFQHICVSLDLNFNESLTDDIVSFEQLGPLDLNFNESLTDDIVSFEQLGPDDNLTKHQWIFTKLGMCIDFMKIWFVIANRQIMSTFVGVFLYPPHGIIISDFYLILVYYPICNNRYVQIQRWKCYFRISGKRLRIYKPHLLN